MTATTRIVRNTTYMYLKMGITLIINLYATRVTLIQLGENDYGLFGVVAGMVNMLGFLNATIMHTTQRFINYHMGGGDIILLKKVFNNSLIIHTLMAIVVLTVMEMAADPVFHDVFTIDERRTATARIIYHLMVITSICTIVTCPYDACINAHEHLAFYAVTGIIESLARLGIVLSLAYVTTDRLLCYGTSLTILSLFLLLVKLLFCQYRYVECRLSVRKYFDWQLIREQLTYATWNFFGVTGIVLGSYSSGPLLNHFFGTSINAAHSVSAQMRGHLLAITNNLSKAVKPVITKKAGEGNLPAMLRFSVTACKVYYLLFAIFAIPFVIETPFLLSVWLKNIPLWTTTFLRWDILISWIELLISPFYTSLFAYGHVRAISIFRGISSLMPLIIMIFLFRVCHTPTLLYLLTFLFVDTVTPCYVLFLMHRHYRLDISRYIFTTLLPALSSAAVAIVVGYCLRMTLHEGWLRLFTIILSVDLLFFLPMLRWGFDDQERTLLVKVLKTFLKKIYIRKI